MDGLEQFMRDLQIAGFDTQAVLAYGFEFARVYAPGTNPANRMREALYHVNEAARKIGIDKEGQRKANLASYGIKV